MTSTATLTVGSAHLPEIAARGLAVPEYDRSELRPRIVHVGVGGFHRAHMALYTDRVAALGGDWGIVGLGLLEQDARMQAALAAQDHLFTLVERGSDSHSLRVVGSLVGFVHAPPGRDDLVADLVAAPDTAILSLTVTESGYGQPSPQDVAAGRSTFDRLAAALDARRRRGGGPLTVLSCDNLPGNGAAAREAVLAAADRVDPQLAAWVAGGCSFPTSMVDRITPVTQDGDRDWLRATYGVDDRWPVVAEPFRQWVMSEEFVAGRPRWEDDGALVTSLVHEWELYKLRLLNAGHSCMAYLAALAGIVYVDEAMATPDVRRFLDRLLHDEALPTLSEIPGHPREDYIGTVFERFASTGIRDQIARLCIDGSAKFPTFLLPTVCAQLDLGGPVCSAATALAGWARYLGTVPSDEQAHDALGERARHFGRAALADPSAFLDYAEVFPDPLRGSHRFRDEFTAAYRLVESRGPVAAMAAAADRSAGATGR